MGEALSQHMQSLSMTSLHQLFDEAESLLCTDISPLNSQIRSLALRCFERDHMSDLMIISFAIYREIAIRHFQEENHAR